MKKKTYGMKSPLYGSPDHLSREHQKCPTCKKCQLCKSLQCGAKPLKKNCGECK